MASSCKTIQNLFVDSLYGELNENRQAELERHLGNCAECASRYKLMEETLQVMSRKKSEQPEENFWKVFPDQVMEQIQPRARRFTLPGWSYQMAAAVLLVTIGILIGYRLSRDHVQPEIAITGKNNGEIIPATVQMQTARYLEKSKILLLGMINMDPETISSQSMDFSRQKDMSRELVKEAAVLKKELDESDQIRLKALVSELELILMQISNYEKQFDIPAIDLIKSSVDNQAILMKINMEEMMIANTPLVPEKQSNNKKRIRL